MEDRTSIVRSMFAAFSAGDFAAFGAHFGADGVLEFPQSGERVRGGDTIAAMYAAAPSTPAITVDSVRSLGDLVIAEATPDYGDGKRWSAVFLVEFDGDAVTRQAAYFGAPFEAPEWRKPFLEGRTPSP